MANKKTKCICTSLYSIPQKGHFNLEFYPTVSDCIVSAFCSNTLHLYHVMFCLQIQQYIAQQINFKNGHTWG